MSGGPGGEPAGRVVAAVVRRDGRVLLCRRPAHKRHGGLWEFPGGKLAGGETHADGARRELREELALEVLAAGEPLDSVLDPASGLLIDFVPVRARGEPRALEHEAIAWVRPERVGSYALAPADATFARRHLT